MPWSLLALPMTMGMAFALLAAPLCLAQSNQSPAPTPAIPEVRFNVTGFEVSGDNPLSAGQAREALAPYVGEHRGLERLQAAARALQARLSDAGHQFHRVVIPPQRSPGGVIELQVLAFTLNRIEVRGNAYFSNDNILASVPALQSGAVPDAHRINRSLQVANDNVFKRSQVTMRESDKAGTLDALVSVADTKPWRLVAMLNNRGTPQPSRTRASIAYHHGNLFDRDHEVVLSFLTAPRHINDVKLLAGTYRIPLYALGGSIDAAYIDADVDVGTVAEVFNVASRGRFALLRYTQALQKHDTYSHRVSLSVEDKFFASDVNLLGTPVGNDLRSRPLTLRYAGEWRQARTTLGLHLEYARNLPGGVNNDSAAYAASRSGADSDWSALRYGIALDHDFDNGWRVRADLLGQQANEALISGEQFGVGGGDSVRGFEERALSGDSGQQLKLSMWTPPLWQRYLRLLAFVDQGRIEREQVQAAERSHDRIASIGAGLRWDWHQLSLGLTAGHVLRGGAVARHGDRRVHFTLALQL